MEPVADLESGFQSSAPALGFRANRPLANANTNAIGERRIWSGSRKPHASASLATFL